MFLCFFFSLVLVYFICLTINKILRYFFLDEAARQALDWGLMELQEFLEDEELALGSKGEGPGMASLYLNIKKQKNKPNKKLCRLPFWCYSFYSCRSLKIKLFSG
jgi:hypothetical protein